MKPCRACKELIAADALTCPRCGKSGPHGLSPIVKYGGGGIVLLVLVAQLAQRAAPPPTPEQIAEGQRQAAQQRFLLDCRAAVKASLQAPETAEFPGLLDAVPPPRLQDDGTQTWTAG